MTSECSTLHLNQVVSLEVGMCPGILMHPHLSQSGILLISYFHGAISETHMVWNRQPE